LGGVEGSREREERVEPEVREEPRARPPEAPSRERALTTERVRSLQRSAGNAAVGRLLSARAGGRVLARDPEIEATDDEMGQHVVDDLVRANNGTTKSATKGVHYAHNYQALAKKDATAKGFWIEDYWKGYANPTYWNRVGHMSWQLKAGADAAAAIQDWLAGVTIAECASVLVAIELDTIRAAVGDNRFNAMFSSLNQLPEREHLKLNQYWTKSSTAAFMRRTDEAAAAQNGPEEVGKRSVKKGEWYYFYNHPKYLLKHPGGAFQGENSICMDDTIGAQKYSGFGVGVLTEPEMLQEMAKAYNRDRTERDYQKLVEKFAPDKAREIGRAHV